MKKSQLQKIIIAVSVFVAIDIIAIFVVLFFPKDKETIAPEMTVAETEIQTVPPQTTAVPETKPQTDTLTLSFVGDCMFASNHGHFGEKSFNRCAQVNDPSYFLKNFNDIFFNDDLTIGNCEGVLSDSEDLQEKTVTTEIAFWFKGPSSNAEIFRAGGIDFASVVNNHSHDFGQTGSDDTEKSLEAVGVIPGKRDTVSYVTIKDQKIGILCCSLYSYGYIDDILPKLREMKNEQCDLKILYFHGGIENETVPEDWKIEACHDLVDAGADLIIGSHPHVLQPVELYKNKLIVYSLGNFCFGGNTHPPRNTAVYQAIFTLSDGNIIAREDSFIPCAVYTGSSNNYQPAIVTDENKKQEILDFLYSMY
ncbi:MAG: CapA family protein [Clostridia bacterium]|nr:CapA family protein [Clostridia bacterium]